MRFICGCNFWPILYDHDDRVTDLHFHLILQWLMCWIILSDTFLLRIKSDRYDVCNCRFTNGISRARTSFSTCRASAWIHAYSACDVGSDVSIMTRRHRTRLGDWTSDNSDVLDMSSHDTSWRDAGPFTLCYITNSFFYFKNFFFFQKSSFSTSLAIRSERFEAYLLK